MKGSFFSILIFVLFWALGSGKLHQINEERNVDGQFEQSEAHVPPELAISSALLGGFRSLLIDYLWVRTTILKNKGEFFEAVQTYYWIGLLHPHAAEVWGMGAHDMSYNISVQHSDPESRWNWVNHGIAFARDQGLEYNPDSPYLCNEIAKVYLNKMGEEMDEYHRYYKQRLFLQLGGLLFESSPERIRELAECDLKLSELLNHPSVDKLNGLTSGSRFDLEESMWRFLTDRKSLGEELVQSMSDILDEDEAWSKKWMLYWRHFHLKDRLKLDPVRMLELQEKYGDFDFRTPFAMSLYWGSRALEQVPDIASMDINHLSMVYNALGNMVRRGKYWMDKQGNFIAAPDLSMAGSFHKVLLELKNGTQDEIDLERLGSVHRQFLLGTIEQFYLLGDKEESKKWFEIFHRDLPETDTPKNFDLFVSKVVMNWSEGMTPSKASDIITGLIIKGLYHKVDSDPYRESLMMTKAKANYERSVKYFSSFPRFEMQTFDAYVRLSLEKVFNGQAIWPPIFVERLKILIEQDRLSRQGKSQDE